MFTVFWFIIGLFLMSWSISWLVENNGSVIVNWLGYEMQTDVVTIIALVIVSTILLIFFVTFLTRILTIKFPKLLKFFFKRNYYKNLEKIINKHHQGFEELANLLLAIENHDSKYINLYQKNFTSKIKNKKINDFILGKIALTKNDNINAIKYFSQFLDNNHANILALKSKFNIALEKNDETRIIAYGKQLCRLDNNPAIALKLIPFCKKHQLWKDVKELTKIANINLDDNLNSDEIISLNLFEIKYLYQHKKFYKAQSLAKDILRKDNNNQLALSIMLKSWIKLGFRFCVTQKIKKLWQKNPQLFLADIYDLNYRKFSAKYRFSSMKKLIANSNNNFKNFILARLAFKIGFYSQAIDILKELISIEPSKKAYQILATSQLMIGNRQEYQKNLTLSKNYTK